MIFRYLLFCLLFLHFICSKKAFAQIDMLKDMSISAQKKINIDKANTNYDISKALSEALKVSAIKSCKNASEVGGFGNNSNIRILFPNEIIKVKKACIKIGLSSLISNFETKMNETAELVSANAISIILETIQSLKFSDAIKILNGDSNSATIFLRDNSYDDLYAAFLPEVKKQIDKTGVQRNLSSILRKYNKIPMVKNVNFNLNNYITEKTIDGIFYLISENEKEIRENPKARTTEILKKIFNK